MKFAAPFIFANILLLVGGIAMVIAAIRRGRPKAAKGATDAA